MLNGRGERWPATSSASRSPTTLPTRRSLPDLVFPHLFHPAGGCCSSAGAAVRALIRGYRIDELSRLWPSRWVLLLAG